MLSTLRRALLAACICLTLVAALGATTASAGLDYYHGNTGQTIAPGYAWVTGPARNITENAGYPYLSVCVGAIDVYGGQLSGAGTCGSYNLGDKVTHPYCGCVLRDGAIYPYGSNTGYIYTAYETS